MNSFNDGALVVTTFIVILLGYWAVIATILRYRYVPLVEYEQTEFD